MNLSELNDKSIENIDQTYNEEFSEINEKSNNANKLCLKFKTKQYKTTSNGKKKKVKKKRKSKPDNIRKKIKARFHKAIKNILNENLIKAGSEELFDFMPQSFIGNISKKVNSRVMNFTFKELLSYDFNKDINKEYINSKVDYAKFYRNQKTLKYLEDNPEISKKSGFSIVKDMKYKENTFTPLKNEIIAYNFFSPAMRIESPFESKNNFIKLI